MSIYQYLGPPQELPAFLPELICHSPECGLGSIT